MPGLMVHLITAFKYDPNPSLAFLIGNIGPDSVTEWKAKDKSHLRDSTDRQAALTFLSKQLDLTRDFDKGVLLHLFLDYYWDIGPRDDFILNWKDGFWFEPYRKEIALSSAWLFHHKPWSRAVWDAMEAYPLSQYGIIHDLVPKDILKMIQRNNLWHQQNNIGPSTYFTTEFVESFTDTVAADFKSWVEVISN